MYDLGMLTIFTQVTGGPDLLRAALRANQEGVYVEGAPTPGVLELAASLGRLRVAFPEHGLHPEDQTKVAEELLQLAKTIDVTIATHSVNILSALKDGLTGTDLTVKVYTLTRDGVPHDRTKPYCDQIVFYERFPEKRDSD